MLAIATTAFIPYFNVSDQSGIAGNCECLISRILPQRAVYRRENCILMVYKDSGEVQHLMFIANKRHIIPSDVALASIVCHMCLRRF